MVVFAGFVANTAAAVSPATPSGPLLLKDPVQPVKAGRDQIYLVQLKGEPVASYTGTLPGLMATKPSRGQRLDASKAEVRSYAQYLQRSQDDLLASVGGLATKLHNYQYAFNGFAAQLSTEQVSQLVASGQVERVWEDSVQRVALNNSARFLGLQEQTGGLRADLGLTGEGIVVGIIDSGIAPGHPALDDTIDLIPRLCQSTWAESSWLGLFFCRAKRDNPEQELVYDPPARFSGECQTGEGFDGSACNNKVVGARFYVDGFDFRFDRDPGEVESPRDADGHGTHIATTIAGNTSTVSLFGTRVDEVKGIAHRARVAIYKACWLQPGQTRADCATSDLTRAIDDAVADGVDIINYSVGSSFEFDLTAPDDIALLNALDAGVLTVVAAGNDGPDLATVASPASAPWVLTAAASSQNGQRFVEALRVTEPTDLSGLYTLREGGLTPPLADVGPVSGNLIAVEDSSEFLADGSLGSVRDACENLVNESALNGNIAFIARGGCDFSDKILRAQDAGAIAVVVYNNVLGEPIAMLGDGTGIDIPAVMITQTDGEQWLEELDADVTVTLEIEKGVFRQQAESGNVVANFSSRGPNLSLPDVMKPDVTAPGVNILAGHTPNVASGVQGEQWQYLTGTSMSTPHVAAVAALLKEANPDWTPAQIKSALMTTSYRSGVVREDGAVADSFDVGAGHISANTAIDPGLVYDADFSDYAAIVCGLERNPFSPADCAAFAAAGRSSDPAQLNSPNITVSELITGQTVTRRVTNLGPASTYSVDVSNAPLGVGLSVNPPTLNIGSGDTQSFDITFTREGAPLNEWTDGTLTWGDGTRTVTSAVTVRPVGLKAPNEVAGSGSAGSLTFPLAFGYSGAYLGQVHGLREPLRLPGFVEEDATNRFSFRFENGVDSQLINIPPGQLIARFSLFNELTDGNDDLDLYLFFCPNNQCTQVAQSGAFDSDEEITIAFPTPGVYAALIHGFETDLVSGGPGANYELLAWSFGEIDNVGNMTLTAPMSATEGVEADVRIDWSGLEPATRYLGGISHSSPLGLEVLTIVTIDTP